MFDNLLKTFDRHGKNHSENMIEIINNMHTIVEKYSYSKVEDFKQIWVSFIGVCVN